MCAISKGVLRYCLWEKYVRSQTRYLLYPLYSYATHRDCVNLAIAIGALGVQNCGLVIRRSNWAVSLACLQGTETNFPLDLQKWQPMILMGCSYYYYYLMGCSHITGQFVFETS